MSQFIKVQQCAKCKLFIPLQNFASHICSDQDGPLQPKQQQLKKTEEKNSIKKLIHCVEIRRPLWDHKRLKLVERSEAIRNKLWRDISEELGNKFDVNNLKLKWKYLRDEYTRRKKGSKSGSGATNEWFYMRHLAFLDDMIIYELTVSNLLPGPSTTPKSDCDKKNVERKKRKLDNKEDQMSTLINELIMTCPKTPPEEKMTADEKFGSYLISLMADLPLAKKRILQGQFIASVLSE